MSTTSAEILLRLLRLLEPLGRAVDSPEELSAFVRRFGWTHSFSSDDQSAFANLLPLAGATSSIREAYLAHRHMAGAPDAMSALETLGPALEAVEELGSTSLGSSFPLDNSEFWNQLGIELLDMLFVEHVALEHPLLMDVLVLLDLVTLERVFPAGTGRAPYSRVHVAWDEVLPALIDPAGRFVERYGAGPDFDYRALLDKLQSIAFAHEVPAELRLPTARHALSFYSEDDLEAHAVRELRIPIAPVILSDEGFRELSVTLLPVPAGPGGAPAGIAIIPELSASGRSSLVLGPDLSLAFEGSLGGAGGHIVWLPDGISGEPPPTGTLAGSLHLGYRPDTPRLLFGSEDGTHLRLAAAELSASIRADAGEPEMILLAGAVSAEGPALSGTIDVADADSFLRYVLGDEPIEFASNFALSWSSERGLGMNGRASLEVVRPLNLSLPFAELTSLLVAVRADEAGLAALVAVDGRAELGPLGVSVQRIGLQAVLQPSEQPGPFGRLTPSLAFLPPTGLGLAIDAGPVSGGGFLFFDADRGEYAGAVELTVGKLGLQAVGLLNTVLPDGSDGFSLLVIISGEFPPVQLGFGFTLNAVGGLLGIHRSVDREALEAGFESRTLDSIMFPENVVENAPRILADLRAVFPPVRDQYVFGPMAMLGWGTPPLLLAELAVVLELPSPLRLFVLGQFHAYLPSEEIEPRIAEIHMDVLGVIDFDRQEAAIDAALYDSRVSIYNLTGEMAMRLAWGGRPNFALSVGGLNPRFEPPPSFPVLDRLAVSLGSGKNPRISLGCYLAVTSNSVQVGARLDIRASKMGFTVTGLLGFDALFEFDPFRFQVDLYGMVDVSKGRRTLLQVRLELYLAGPSPWNAAGLAEFRALKLKVRVRFEVEFGRREDPALPAVSPWDELKKELRDPRSWEAELPAASSRLVTFGGAGRGNDILVHPGGTLAVRQRVVPFGLKLERYGNASPGHDDRFVLDEVALVNDPQVEDFTPVDPDRAVMAYFAPAQFLEMGDDEKVSAPAFERMQAGVRFGDEAMHEPATDARRPKVYRTVTVVVGGEATDEGDGQGDADHGSAADRDADRAAEQRDGVLAISAKAVRARRGAASASGRDRFRGPGPGALGVEDIEYVIARVDTLERVVVAGQAGDRSAGSGTYARVRQRLRAHVASNPELEGHLQIVGAHEVAGP